MSKSALFTSLKKTYHEHSKVRREVIGKANQGLNLSKRAIFALHRDDAKEAAKLLADAEKQFVACDKHIKKFPDLKDGAYKAGIEEYAEALLFVQYLEKGKFGKLPARVMAPQCYLAGLSDTTGEIVRYAIRQATKGNHEEAEKALKTVEEVIEYLLQMDLTGYLRTKFDQAKKNLRNLENVVYDLSLRS